MSIAFGGIKKEIADSGSRNVSVLRSDIGEHDSRRNVFAGPPSRCLAKILFAEIRETK